MKSTTLALALSVLSPLTAADYGNKFSNSFSTGPTAKNNFIREAISTLIVPKVNSPQNGYLDLWPGMTTTSGNLIQGLAISAADKTYDPRTFLHL